MRLKDGHMQNGQLKPAYNVQVAAKNQFITHYDSFPNPAGFLAFKPFVEGYKERFGGVLKKMVAGSGYGSEENYDFMEANGIEPFVKFPVFHKGQEKASKNKAFLAQNMFYNAGKDFLVCPVGQRMEKVGEGTRKSDGGYVPPVSYYEAENCTNCPLKVFATARKATGGSRPITT
jgi:hypothetical protein